MTRLVISLALTATAVSAQTRSSPWGKYPDSPMFLDDNVNVLEYLTQFQSLYIKHHACVWSPYSTGSSSNRANAAFSLYGVLNDGVTRKLESADVCGQQHYINSFFTTYGAATISTALGIDEDYASAECTIINGDRGATMACVAGAYVYDIFSGNQCDKSSYLRTQDTLNHYNECMAEINCTQILDYDVGGRRLESVAESILSESNVCSIKQYPEGCPDPFGMKEKRRIAIARYQSRIYRRSSVGVGLTLVCLALVYHRIRRKQERKNVGYADADVAMTFTAASSRFYCAPALNDSSSSMVSSINSRVQYYNTGHDMNEAKAENTPMSAHSRPTPSTPKEFPIPDFIDGLLYATSASSLSSRGIEGSDTMNSMYESLEMARLQTQRELIGGAIPSTFFEALEAAWGEKTPAPDSRQ